jgi:hypothetical protein
LDKPSYVISGTRVQDCHRFGSAYQAEIKRSRFDIKRINAELTVNPKTK